MCVILIPLGRFGGDDTFAYPSADKKVVFQKMELLYMAAIDCKAGSTASFRSGRRLTYTDTGGGISDSGNGE